MFIETPTLVTESGIATIAVTVPDSTVRRRDAPGR